MVELRKRKPAAEPPAPPPSRKKSNPVTKAVDKAKEAITGNKTNGATSASSAVTVGETISLDGFGGEVETHDGDKTTLKKLVEESKSGVVLFTYPKASTPGCEYKLRGHPLNNAFPSTVFLATSSSLLSD